jgi:excinuclease ABC subunit B
VGEQKGEYKVKPGSGGYQKQELARIISELEKQMKEAARNLEFEKAALIRDQVYEMRVILAEESNLKPWEKVKILAGQE